MTKSRRANYFNFIYTIYIIYPHLLILGINLGVGEFTVNNIFDYLI